jgi:hypothetical protein
MSTDDMDGSNNGCKNNNDGRRNNVEACNKEDDWYSIRADGNPVRDDSVDAVPADAAAVELVPADEPVVVVAVDSEAAAVDAMAAVAGEVLVAGVWMAAPDAVGEFLPAWSVEEPGLL